MVRVVPTFAVALTGDNVSPERVTVRALSEILSAVQTLVSGKDVGTFDEEEEEEAETETRDTDALSLLDVKKGSAVFPCLARRPGAIDNLKRIGKFLKSPESVDDDRFSFAIRPTKILSAIARQLECVVEIRPAGDSRKAFASINGSTYTEVAKSLLISGQSTISGKVQRVGGATNMRCALRIPARERLLYCDVASPDVSRKLGENLYQDVAVTGTATWFQRSWSLYTFKVVEMRPLRRTRLTEAVKAIYEAGGKGWDTVSNIDESIHELR